MPLYVDGFVIPIPRKNLSLYRRISAKAGMKDPRIAKMMTNKAQPFDMKRMLYGGFKVLVDA